VNNNSIRRSPIRGVRRSPDLPFRFIFQHAINNATGCTSFAPVRSCFRADPFVRRRDVARFWREFQREERRRGNKPLAFPTGDSAEWLQRPRHRRQAASVEATTTIIRCRLRSSSSEIFQKRLLIFAGYRAKTSSPRHPMIPHGLVD